MPARDRIELPIDVVARIRRRDPEAFDEIIRATGASLVAFAAGILDSQDAAEDVLQDVLFRVWELGERFDPAGSLVAYLFTAVRNAALNVRRHDAVESRYRGLADEGLSPTDATSPDRAYDAEEGVAALRHVLAEAPERQRSAFELRYGQGMTVPEVARALGITTGSAANLLTRVTRLVRSKLDTLRIRPES